MSNKIEKFKKAFENLLKAMLDTPRDINMIGVPDSISLNLSGDHLKMHSKYDSVMQLVLSENGCTMINDSNFELVNGTKGDWTVIHVSFIPSNEVSVYLNKFSKSDDLLDPKLHKIQKNNLAKELLPVLANALGKCILIADNLNNRFGEGVHDASTEITECDQVLKLYKESYGS